MAHQIVPLGEATMQRQATTLRSWPTTKFPKTCLPGVRREARRIIAIVTTAEMKGKIAMVESASPMPRRSVI